MYSLLGRGALFRAPFRKLDFKGLSTDHAFERRDLCLVVPKKISRPGCGSLKPECSTMMCAGLKSFPRRITESDGDFSVFSQVWFCAGQPRLNELESDDAFAPWAIHPIILQ